MPNTKSTLLAWHDHLFYKRRKIRIDKPLSDRVICHINGRSFKRFYKSWWAACKLANLKNFHFHDLRHTFCSNLLLSGADLKDVKEMIGHKDLSMTDRYAHLTLTHKRKQQNQLAKYYTDGSAEPQEALNKGFHTSNPK